MSSRFSIRWWLGGLVAAVAVPLLLLASLLYVAQAQREQRSRAGQPPGKADAADHHQRQGQPERPGDREDDPADAEPGHAEEEHPPGPAQPAQGAPPVRPEAEDTEMYLLTGLGDNE